LKDYKVTKAPLKKRELSADSSGDFAQNVELLLRGIVLEGMK